MLLLLLYNYLERVVTDADGCGQEGSAIEVCTTAVLKRPLTEDTCYYVTISHKGMVRIVCNFLYLMKNSLHSKKCFCNLYVNSYTKREL